MRLARLLALVCLLTVGCTPAAASTPATSPTTIRIAAAADVRPAFDELLPAFEQTSGYRTLVSYGSSGNFYQQLQNGAPFDVFFSADVEYTRRLSESGHTAGDPVPYAQGRLAVWTRGQSTLNDAVERWVAGLAAADVRSIAVANPEHAPYGRAAVAAIRGSGRYDALGPKLVFGDNVAHAAQMAQSGAADVAIIALSLVLSPGMRGGSYHLIASDAHPPIEQAAVVLRTDQAEAARALIRHVNAPEGRSVLTRYGFEPPPTP